MGREGYEAWAQRVERETKGPIDRLETKLEDGRRLRALYTEAPFPAAGVRGAPPPGRSAPQVWTRVRGPDLTAANRRLLQDLAGGATGLRLALEGEEDLDALLKGVRLDAISLAFEPGPRSRDLADSFLRFSSKLGAPKASLAVHFGFDPLGSTARFGGSKETLAARFDDAAKAVSELGPVFGSGRVLELDMGPYHEAGASPDFELACLASSLVATLRGLEARGVPPEEAARQLSLTIPLDADFLLGLIKLRASRAIVHRVLEASGVPERLRSLPLFACTSRRMLTSIDPFVNVLRGTSASFAALTGGADAVEVAPYDERGTAPSEAARRLARNTTHVLVEEAHLARVADPAGGAYFFEAETRAMGESAWASFRAMESEGGFEALLYRGQIALVAEANHFEQSRALQTRKRNLIGLTEFVDLEAPAVPSPTLAAATPLAPALPRHALAEPFEALRTAAAAHAQRTGQRPEVQLLTLGDRSEHEARTAWVTNLVAAGGLGHTREARPVVIVSGADERYESEAAPLAQTLRALGTVRHLALAGKPKHETALRLAGFDSFIFRGEDVVAFLSEIQRALGVIE